MIVWQSSCPVITLATMWEVLTRLYVARKNSELLAQISQLNKQLQESAAENFQLRGVLSTLQRKSLLDNAKIVAYQRERQAMLDLVDETTRAVGS